MSLISANCTGKNDLPLDFIQNELYFQSNFVYELKFGNYVKFIC